MDWDRIKKQLESVLGSTVRWSVFPENVWKEYASKQSETPEQCKSIAHQYKIHFMACKEDHQVHCLAIDEVMVTASERKLIELMLEARSPCGKKPTMDANAETEDEKKVMAIRNWCHHQLELGNTSAEIPDHLARRLSLYSVKVPILLTEDYSHNRKVTHQDLKKLLESFFEEEIILIPLMEKEWLILGPEGLLNASNGSGQDNAEDETVEEALASICSGLHEMLENEWVGECHLAIHYPMTPVKTLLPAIVQLRETMQLGRAFHVGSSIHLPWKLRLERLLHAVPDAEKTRFLENVLKNVEHLLDVETLATLEMFFTLDCNVSETAKRLYIHRNTLLYRLDRFKQETGLDVRNFNDAMLVKLALLLYKVTKK